MFVSYALAVALVCNCSLLHMNKQLHESSSTTKDETNRSRRSRLKMTLTSEELCSLTEEDFTGDYGFGRYSQMIRAAVENRRRVVAEAAILISYDEAAEQSPETRRGEFRRATDETLCKLDSSLIAYPNLEVMYRSMGNPSSTQGALTLIRWRELSTRTA